MTTCMRQSPAGPRGEPGLSLARVIGPRLANRLLIGCRRRGRYGRDASLTAPDPYWVIGNGTDHAPASTPAVALHGDSALIVWSDVCRGMMARGRGAPNLGSGTLLSSRPPCPRRPLWCNVSESPGFQTVRCASWVRSPMGSATAIWRSSCPGISAPTDG
jgi:hypothetical protein